MKENHCSTMPFLEADTGKSLPITRALLEPRTQAASCPLFGLTLILSAHHLLRSPLITSTRTIRLTANLASQNRSRIRATFTLQRKLLSIAIYYELMCQIVLGVMVAISTCPILHLPLLQVCL